MMAPLAHLINLSIANILEKGCTHPFKWGGFQPDFQLTFNISLTGMSMILENVVEEQLINCNLLHHHQFGFRLQHYTTQHLINKKIIQKC